MRKLIKKCEVGGSLGWTPTFPTLQDPTSQITNYFTKNLGSAVGMTGRLKMPSLASSLPPAKIPDKITSPVGQLESQKVGGQSFFGSLGKGLSVFGSQIKDFGIDAAPQVVDIATQALGIKNADISSTGEKAFSTIANESLKTGLKSGNPIAMGIGAGLKALSSA